MSSRDGITALSPRRVAVLRALQLGDMLCAVPVFRALRAAWPESEIILVGLPWARQFVQRFADYFDGFREFPGFPGLPEREPDVARIPSFLAAIQQERFDLAIQLHGSGAHVNPIVQLFGAQRSAGFYVPGEYCPDPDTFTPWPQSGLEIHRLLALTDHLGMASQGDELEFPLSTADFRTLDSLSLTEPLVPGRFACVHPGASTSSRRWSPDNFAAVADWLADRGLTIVLTGVANERALTAAVSRSMDHLPIDVAGMTDLGTLAALFSKSALLVSNDTGVSHLAAALRVPSVIISTGDNPARWAPTDQMLHRVLCSARGVTVEEAQQAVAIQLTRTWPMRHRGATYLGNEQSGSSKGIIPTAYAGGV